MSDLKQTVSLTNANSDNMSRHQMLEWVNNVVGGNFKKIEEMASGVAYCQMLEMIFPNCINLKRVKFSAKLEHEFFHNMKLFQGALTNLKLDKTVPIERLIKGRFQDNLEFLQWFKKFFVTQAPDFENVNAELNEEKLKAIQSSAMLKEEQQISEFLSSIEELNVKISSTVETRDGAYQKLRKIEILLTEMVNNNAHVDFCSRVFQVLYKSDQNEDDVIALSEELSNCAADDPNEASF